VPGAINPPHGKLFASKMSGYPAKKRFRTYCAGPHCNGAAAVAARPARLGYAVKIMVGGVTLE